ncbi:MAG: methyltransferase domain-containing protein [Candidatus Aureabacteria bacterium]|nr:methyltransferase domain-containing protein [Candidatus Auribacterota bacterium]
MNKDGEITIEQLLDSIAAAQTRLYDKLAHLDVTSLNISEYNQRYLGNRIANLKGVLQLYGRLLSFCLNKVPVHPENFVLVDYGGGSGLISLLAAESGIRTVIYNDIYDVSCRDVRLLSHELGLKLDHIVCGDLDELISYLHKNSISVDAITSYDVLEHIYDVEYHFHKLTTLSDRPLRVVYASGANIANLRYVFAVKKKQIEAEYKNREKKWGYKQCDSLQAFFDVRKKIISSYAPDMSLETVEHLAGLTRGLVQKDIEKCVDEFRLEGKISYHMDHPTNTCDPTTGNWCEHLLDFEWLKRILEREGFSVKIIPGPFNSDGFILRKGVKIFLNTLMRIFGQCLMFMAPYYIVYADFSRPSTAGHDNEK